jgi:hypothetical protein
MATYIITCDHAPEECEPMDKEWQQLGVPEVIKGKPFYCSCPHGHHGGWVTVEGESAEAILNSLTPLFRSHAKVHQIETVVF